MKKTCHPNLVANVAERARRVVIVKDHASVARTLVSALISVLARMRATAAKADMDVIWVFQSRRMILLWKLLYFLLLWLEAKAAQTRARRERGSVDAARKLEYGCIDQLHAHNIIFLVHQYISSPLGAHQQKLSQHGAVLFYLNSFRGVYELFIFALTSARRQCFIVLFRQVSAYLYLVLFMVMSLGIFDLVKAYWTSKEDTHTPYYDRWMIILDEFPWVSGTFALSSFFFLAVCRTYRCRFF